METSRTVLLVEDDADDREFFLDALLGIADTTVYDVVENGHDALVALKSHSVFPDIIFMDINMPVMNGIECLREIIRNPLTSNIPVVMLSTNSDQMVMAGEIGARVFLMKPVALVDLQDQIDGPTLNKFEPALQRAYTFIMNDWPSTMGFLDHLLATFFIDVTKLFIR